MDAQFCHLVVNCMTLHYINRENQFSGPDVRDWEETSAACSPAL
uniref:Uncharacterized protein n=1 Tax=Anguilla anguilla TaxID=7936 RepID=A0A0E9W3Q4_ANGAN